MALATAFAVVACGSDAGNSAAPPAAGSHSAHAGGSSAPPQPLRAGERFVDLKMAEAYTPAPPEGGGTDEYRCQMIDPVLTKAAFLTGTQFMPENVAIAHHAIVYAVPPGGAALLREQDAKTPGLGWQCFGGTGVDGADVEDDDEGADPGAAWVDTWAPGATETLLDQDAGFKLEPGSLIIFQMHYNLLATDGKPGGSDRSAVRLRLLIVEDSPHIVGYDQEEFARRLYYDRPIDASLAAFKAARETTAELLERMSEEEFRAYVREGGQVETGDPMPDDYRKALIKFIEMHGNSELMGVLPEREWILRAPTLKRKLALTSKVQDEVGHAQLLYRVAEDLGKPREAMLQDLLAGKKIMLTGVTGFIGDLEPAG